MSASFAFRSIYGFSFEVSKVPLPFFNRKQFFSQKNLQQVRLVLSSRRKDQPFLLIMAQFFVCLLHSRRLNKTSAGFHSGMESFWDTGKNELSFLFASA